MTVAQQSSAATPVQSTYHKTALYDWHLSRGAKMVPFAGYEMPVQYTTGIIQEHQYCRQAAVLFDVSHMGQVVLTAALGLDGLREMIEKVLPADIMRLQMAENRFPGVYSILPNHQGGIIDDLIVFLGAGENQHMATQTGSAARLIVNASRKYADLDWLQHYLPQEAQLDYRDDWSLLALQGPQAADLLQKIAPGVQDLRFMQGGWFTLQGSGSLNDVTLFITRSGYTGEDGFELSVPNDKAALVADLLTENGLVKPAGLGARDSLRLEAGLCLYGQDMDEETSPVAAGLAWTIGKQRRNDGARQGGFPGSDVILAAMAKDNPKAEQMRRVGVLLDGRAIARSHVKLFSADGQPIGEVTSGGYAPTLEASIAFARVEKQFSKAGTTIVAEIRGRRHPGQVVKLPFYTPKYVT